jgi:D-psicose/D-tagatose/L-ribulose 3-epimerase
MQVSIISTFLGPEHEGLPKLAKIGFRLVEIERGAAASADVRALKGLLDRNGMAVSCLMGADHGIAEKDATTRKDRIEKLKGSVKQAVELGATVVETVPMWHGPAEEKRAALEHAVESYKEAGKFAANHGVVLAIEPVNRAETKLVHTLAQAVAMAKAVDLPSVRVMGDTHHMHMVEADPGRAIRQAGELLVHMHFSDNDRLPPGLGHMDIKGVVSALHEVGYRGALSLAEVRAVGDGEACARHCLDYTRALVSACQLQEKPSP